MDFRHKPSITFIAVDNQRHHTLLFPDDETGGENVQPGTIVDTEIVRPNSMDFFLVSHEPIQVIFIDQLRILRREFPNTTAGINCRGR